MPRGQLLHDGHNCVRHVPDAQLLSARVCCAIAVRVRMRGDGPLCPRLVVVLHDAVSDSIRNAQRNAVTLTHL